MKATLVSTIDTMIPTLSWPAEFTPTGAAIWERTLAPMAVDTDLVTSNAYLATEFWYVCAWMLELSDAIANRDDARTAAALAAVGAFHDTLAQVDLGGIGAAALAEASKGEVTTARSFVDANACVPWPR